MDDFSNNSFAQDSSHHFFDLFIISIFNLFPSRTCSWTSTCLPCFIPNLYACGVRYRVQPNRICVQFFLFAGLLPSSPSPALIKDVGFCFEINGMWILGWVSSLMGEFLFPGHFRTDGTLVSNTMCDYQFSSAERNQAYGKFHSPRYPSRYPKNVRCTYTFQARWANYKKFLVKTNCFPLSATLS